jgi:hypothetical protein
LGTKTENVTLGLGPSPAKFIDYTYINGNVHTDWIIKSHQTVTELQILYRNNKVIEAHDSLNENLWLNYWFLFIERLAAEDSKNHQP